MPVGLIQAAAPVRSAAALVGRLVDEYSCSSVALLLMLRATALSKRTPGDRPANARKCLETLLYTYIDAETATRHVAQFAAGTAQSVVNDSKALVDLFLKLVNLEFARSIACSLDNALRAAQAVQV